MKLYAVYANDIFIDYFDTLYEARRFIAHCEFAMFAADCYQSDIFEIVEEDV